MIGNDRNGCDGRKQEENDCDQCRDRFLGIGGQLHKRTVYISTLDVPPPALDHDDFFEVVDHEQQREEPERVDDGHALEYICEDSANAPVEDRCRCSGASAKSMIA